MQEFLKSFLPEQASTFAESVDLLYFFLIGVTIFFGALIFGLVFLFAIIYRRRSDSERPEPIEGNHLLEALWLGIPFVFTMVMFVWGTWLFVSNQQEPKNALEIFVVGKQWMWKIQHPEGQREINALHIPVNRPVKILMTSEDVIHSFYIPAFRVKMDTVPGRYTKTWFEATKPGEYHLFCAEYCGTKHSQMIGTVYAMAQDDYQGWLDEQLSPLGKAVTGSLAEQGAQLFKQLRCYTCHAEESSSLGPSLHDIYKKPVMLDNGKTITADENYLRESILYPSKRLVAGFGPLMPTFTNQVNEEQILTLIAYLKSLSPAHEEARETAIQETLAVIQKEMEAEIDGKQK